MSSESTSLSERLAADFTRVWLLAGVDEHVCIEITPLSEGFAAGFTYEWLFTCVDEQM